MEPSREWTWRACAVLLAACPAGAQLTMPASVRPPGIPGNALSGGPLISADGRLVTFHSEATDLVPGMGTPGRRAYVHDRLTSTVELVSVSMVDPSESWGSPCAISADGRFVAILTQAALVASDTNGRRDMYVRDRQTGVTERVSIATSGAEGDGDCIDEEGAISGDGRFVVFSSDATNLVPGDTNGVSDAFLRDRSSGTTERVSLAWNGAQIAGASAVAGTFSLSVSGDGRFVTFYGEGEFVPGAAGGVFVRDRVAGTTECLTVTPSGQPSQDWSWNGSLSDDGRHAVFSSFAGDLVPLDPNGGPDVFVRDLLTGTTALVSFSWNGAATDGWGWNARISADGRSVVFTSGATNLVPVDTNGFLTDVFVRDLAAGTTELVSRSTSGAQPTESCFRASVSGDGRFVAFDTHAPNLAPWDTNGALDVFLRDRASCTFASYCAAKPNSAGCTPSVTASGVPSASAGSGFVIGAERVLPQQSGLLFYSVSGPLAASFQGGYRCAKSPIRRTSVQVSGSSGTPPCSGTYAFDFNAHVATGLDPALVAGRQVWAQYWSRDAGTASGTGLTNALTFVLCP